MEHIFENIPFTAPAIQEAKGTLKEGVLAIVKGPSFFSDGYSRNGRFYPKELWENALKLNQTKEAISRGLMFGCIGHPKNYTLDELLESGKVSHKVTDITIDEKTGDGIATYEILDTPAGRILDTIIRSGSEMYVSTRAFGGFTNETKKKDGRDYKVLDTKNFELESIDFVIQPGFLSTNPKLVESISSDLEILSEDKARIQCSEGICQLKEDLVEISESKNKPEDIFEGINDLPKEDIISMLRNVVAENKLLSTKEKTPEVVENNDMPSMDDEKSITVDEKLLRSYIGFVELLTKLVRYDVEYTDIYESLIDFLDKDDKLTKTDVDSISGIVDKILSEEAVDESIIKVCEKIKHITSLFDEKTSEEDKLKGASESVVDLMAELVFRPSDKFAMVELEGKNETLKGQIARLKQATIALSEQSIITEEKIVEVEKEVPFTPKEISEKLVSLTEQNKQLKSDLENARTSEAKNIEEKQTLIEELTTKISVLEETITENDGFARDTITENQKTIKALKEELSGSKDKEESALAKVSKLTERLADAITAKESAEISAEASIYRLERPVVEGIFEKYPKASERQKMLEKESKLVRKSATVVEDIPNYTPKSRNRTASSRLENLMN